ncbi:hypothetical protein RQP46_010171 [Phenoliferia psychrophenolica]
MTTPPLHPLQIFSPVLPQTPPPVASPPSAITIPPLSLSDRPSPPPTPTPSSGGPSLLLLNSTRMRAISPPTPAPSPQPFGSSRFPPSWSHPNNSTSPTSTEQTDDDILLSIRSSFAQMPPHLRLRLLTSLLADSSPALLSPLLPLITPRLKRDFLRTLPLELAFHVLSFVDDVRTLARASGVSRFWRALLEDEGTWKRMCWKSGFGDLGGMTGRLRTLEFGEREEEEGTPAGRERRGTLDRVGLTELAARAELFGLRPALGGAEREQSWNSVAGGVGGGIVQQPRALVPPGWETWARDGGLGFDDHDEQQPVASGSGTTHHDPSPSPFPPSLPPTATTTLSASLPITLRSLSLSSSLPASSSSLPLPSPSHSSATANPRKPFSYKTHFKRAYLTESAWLRGPGRELSTQQSADDGVVTSLGFDGEWIVVGMATSKVHIFESGSGGSQQAGVCGTARGYGQSGAIVVSGGCDRDVRVWDVETGECRHVLRGHTSTVRCMRVIDGRPIAVSGSRDATLRVWNIQTGEAMHLLAGHEHSVRCIEVSGNKVVSGSYDATCRLWDVDTGECLFVFRGHIHQIYAVAFDGIRVVTGSLDSTVRIWSATTGEFLALLQGHTSLVGQLQLDPISNVLVTGGSDGRVIVFDLRTFETRHRLCAHDNSVTCLQFDDRFIVTGGNDGRIKLWDFKTGAFIREIGDACEAVWRVTFRDDKCVILCRKEGKTMMDVKTFRPSEQELHGDV